MHWSDRRVRFVASLIVTFGLSLSAAAQAVTPPACIETALSRRMPGEDYAANRAAIMEVQAGIWQDIAELVAADDITSIQEFYCQNLDMFVFNEANADGSDEDLAPSVLFDAMGEGVSAFRPTAPLGDDFAPSAPEDVLFTWRSAPLPPTLWLTNGGSTVQPTLQKSADGPILHVEAPGSTFIRFSDLPEITDYAVETRVRVNSGLVTLVARSQGSCSAFMLSIDPAQHRATLIFREDCESHAALLVGRTDTEIPAGQWIDLRFEVAGNALMASLNGEPLLSTIDPRLSKGAPLIGIAPAAGQTSASVDVARIRLVRVTPPPDALQSYSGTPETIIEELRENGSIPDGGALIFTGRTMHTHDVGATVPIFLKDGTFENLVIGGTVRFASGAPQQGEGCGLSLRIGRNTSAPTSELVVGIDGEGTPFMGDQNMTFGPMNVHLRRDLRFMPGNRYQVVVIANGSEVSAYIDGQRVLLDTAASPRAGLVGMMLTAQAHITDCTWSGMWLYQLP